MDRGFVNKVSTVKIGDKIRLIRAADPNLGIKSKEIGTVVDTSMSKVVDLEGLRLIMWIKWESGKETAIVDGIDLFEIL
jgi:hypothetical protein